MATGELDDSGHYDPMNLWYNLADAEMGELGWATRGLALDIGDRSGVYVPVIDRLGYGSVHVIDPDVRDLSPFIGEGVLEGVFAQTLEEYVAAGHDCANAAFVMNIQPRLSKDVPFVGALIDSVVERGYLVVSMREPITSLSFRTIVERHYPGQASRVEMPLPDRARQSSHIAPNNYIQVWRRN